MRTNSKSARTGSLPPFGRLAALIVSANEHDDAMGFARKLLSAAPQAEGLRLFGPADAPVAMVRGRHRVRLLVQSAKRFRPLRLCPLLAHFGRAGERKSAGSGRHRPDEFLLSAVGLAAPCDKTREKPRSRALRRRKSPW